MLFEKYQGNKFAQIILFVSCGLLIVACNYKQKIIAPTGKSIAFFSDFMYRGMDEYYIENELPAEDYFYNPILPGWYSDPSICRNGEDYFLVTSTFVNFPGVPIFHSKDLVNWKQIGHVLNRESQMLNMEGQYTSGGIYAPAISYNPNNQTYYMITTNVGLGNFFVKTKDPFGSWSDPIRLPNVGGIDPSFFFDNDGKAYIVNNDVPNGEPEYDGHRSIRIHQFDPERDSTFGLQKTLVDKGVRPEEKPIWIEGPHMYTINGNYYLISAEGGTGTNHSEVILRGDSPMGNFIPWDKNPILTQRHLDSKRPNPITSAGHADLIQTKEGDWWAFFLACRPINGEFENLGRETFLMPVKWSDDGYPYLTEGDELIPMIVQREGVKRGGNTTFGNFEKNYSFDSTQLGHDWMTMRTSASDLYSLIDNPGFLSLKCGNASATGKNTPAFICRRLQHHKFECSTQMYFNPSDNHEAAGLLLYKDETHQYFLSVSNSDNEPIISLSKIAKDTLELIGIKQLKSLTEGVRLKVISDGLYYDFYYAIGNDEFQLVCNHIDARYLSTANSFGFTGTTIGMYAVKSLKNE